MRVFRSNRTEPRFESRRKSRWHIRKKWASDREMATFRHQWRLFAEQAQGNSSESHQSHTLVAFSLMATSMAMGETSSDCGVLGADASKIRVWRSVGILFVLFRVYSENIPFFYGFQPFPGSSEHFPSPTHTHTHPPRLPHRSAHALSHHTRAPRR